ncbi:RHS repeat domain-containing protein [Cryobacterium tepidiphilum]|nr:RHS repeat-associated core domain-containing protein [Cryobacterium tepidiphilum]
MIFGLAGAAQATTSGLPGYSDETGLTGARPNATRLSFYVSDQVSATIDVGTGNLMVTSRNLVLPGVNGSVPIGETYNLLGAEVGSTSTLEANNWTLGLGGAGSLAQADAGVVYTGGDGSTWLFTPVSGSSTAFSSPAGLKGDLIKTASGYTLSFHGSGQVVSFDASGNAVSVADRNGNTTTISYTSGQPTSITSTAGPTAARTAALSYSSTSRTLTVSQTSGSLSRSVKYVKDASSNLTSIVDANGKTTSFAYGSNSKLTSITSPTGAVTNFSYNSAGLPVQVDQLNTSVGSPGTATTRFDYTDGPETLVAGPNTAVSPVSAAPHTTYELNADDRVTSATDPEGRSRSRTYTPEADVATATDGTGTTGGTTTATYGANSGESLTKVQSPGGAAGQAAYANTSPGAKYQPSSATDDAGNTSLYTYSGSGNALTASDASSATATLTYHSDGTVATATAPGNGTNKTVYWYTDHQLTWVTPVTGSSLGARDLAYDDFGRLSTDTDGRGITTTYTYDKVDRVLSTSFSDGTPTVSYTYNAAGKTATRVDGEGTTTYGYDQLGRLTSRVNTAGGGTISYGYDKASNLTSTTDSRGTTTYAFDDSGVPTKLNYQYNGGTHVLAFATDDRGRRTDSWMDANSDHSTWVAHTHTDYDTSGRVTAVTAEEGHGNSDNTSIMDLTYCYAAGSTAPTCPTTASSDRSKIQWQKDNLTGAVTAYTYDTAGRLTQAKITGGTSPTTYNYTYDARGNRLTVSGGTAPARTLTVNAANQITSTGYTYDGAGNLTADSHGTYEYNGAEQMTGVTVGGTTYSPDYAGTGQNEILSENTTGGYYKYTYGRTDQNGQPVIEQVNRDNQTAYVEHDPVTGEPLMLRTSSGMQSLYVHDGTGNPTVLVTSGSYRAFAYSYDPYGVPTLTEDSGGNGTSQNPYTFKNGVQERTTGWIHYGARWYDPTTGRFTQQDTMDAPLDPHNANRYAYAGGDPVNNSDPSGTSVLSVAYKILKLIMEGKSLGEALAGLTSGEALGALYGSVVGGACGIFVGTLAIETLGVGLLAGLSCTALAQSASVGFQAIYTL